MAPKAAPRPSFVVPKAAAPKAAAKAKVVAASRRVPAVTDVSTGTRIFVLGIPGVVRFIGPTDFAIGEWCGVELDSPEGKNDGCAPSGTRYFECAPRHGLFCRREIMSVVGTQEGGSGPYEQQLAGLKLGALFLRARTAGALQDQLAVMLDEEEPKKALIAFIVANSADPSVQKPSIWNSTRAIQAASTSSKIEVLGANGSILFSTRFSSPMTSGRTLRGLLVKAHVEGAMQASLLFKGESLLDSDVVPLSPDSVTYVTCVVQGQREWTCPACMLGRQRQHSSHQLRYGVCRWAPKPKPRPRASASSTSRSASLRCSAATSGMRSPSSPRRVTVPGALAPVTDGDVGGTGGDVLVGRLSSGRACSPLSPVPAGDMSVGCLRNTTSWSSIEASVFAIWED